MQVQVVIWVCPTPGCGNYIGTSSLGDLSQAVNRRSALRNLANEKPENWGQVTGTRDECPSCRDRGAKVKRTRVPVTIEVESSEEVPTAA